MFFRIQASFEDFKFLVRFIKKTQKNCIPTWMYFMVMCSLQSSFVRLSVLLIENHSTHEKILRLCVWSVSV